MDGRNLGAENHRQLLTTNGFARGFCAWDGDTHVTYKVDEYYSREQNRGLTWNYGGLQVNWPVQMEILSSKDPGLPISWVYCGGIRLLGAYVRVAVREILRFESGMIA
jgi:dTDP-4-dehydrorhamnose 3,5-epimerase-like enzyme